MKKNILLLFTDQQRYDTIEALGNSLIKTPALNRLVRRGVSFTRAYSPCPVCVPARFAMMTGQLPHQSDCVANETMPEGFPSFMEHLSQNGYQTHGVGKMHFQFKGQGPAFPWGFESRDVSEEGGGEDDFKAFLEERGYGHVHDPQGVRSEMYYIPQPSQLPAELHNTAWVADKSIEFLQRRDTTRPFFFDDQLHQATSAFREPDPMEQAVPRSRDAASESSGQQRRADHLLEQVSEPV